MDYETYEFTWRKREILLRYCPSYSKAYLEVYGQNLSHLEVRSADSQPLPITRTGYLSRFDFGGIMSEEFNSVVEFVLIWLDHEAKNRTWQEYEASIRQLRLF